MFANICVDDMISLSEQEFYEFKKFVNTQQYIGIKRVPSPFLNKQMREILYNPKGLLKTQLAFEKLIRE